MKNSLSNKTIPINEVNGEQLSLCRKKTKWIIALFLCALLGIISGITGLFLSCLTFAGILSRGEGASWISTCLILLAFPLMIFGGHAMDKVAEIDQMQKPSLIKKDDRKKYRINQ